jgi:hypothetical protein
MGGSKTTVGTNQQTKTEIPAEIRNRGTTITNAAMKTYFDPAKKYQSFGTGPNYAKDKAVGEATTGQLNAQHGQAEDNFTQAGSSYKPYFDQAGTAAGQAATNTAQNAQGPNYTTANVQGFMDPYKSAVIDDGVRRLQESYDINRTKLDDQAGKVGGAFGGTRNAVEQSLNTKNFNNTKSDFINSGLSSAFTNAQDQFNTDFSQQLATVNQNNQAAGQNFQQGMTTADFLKNMGKSTQDAQLAAGNAQLGLGNIKTAQEQAEKDNAYSKGYMDRRDNPMETYERLAAMNAMQPHNRTSTTTGTSTEKSSGGWLGPALQAGASVAGMMSDEDSKEDIEDYDGEEALGAFAKVKPKSYEYKDEVIRDYPELASEGRKSGFLAQDMEGAFGREMGPETEDGLKTVDIPNVLGELVAAVHALEKRTRGLRERTA